jgi:4-hydroxy-3-polyprenylbenzoate decarboxylase
MSLAKYLIIADGTQDPDLKAHDIGSFLQWVWERLDFESGLHFQTRTTIDTLDYSGDSLNRGSKVVIAAGGPPRRKLTKELPYFGPVQQIASAAYLCMPGVLAVGIGDRSVESLLETLDEGARADSTWQGIACIVVVDDPEFAAKTLNNFLWVTFTRSNPATDIRGVGERMEDKHWCCSGPLVIDARRKPRHAPPLIENPEVTRKIDALASRGGPLAQYL